MRLCLWDKSETVRVKLNHLGRVKQLGGNEETGGLSARHAGNYQHPQSLYGRINPSLAAEMSSQYPPLKQQLLPILELAFVEEISNLLDKLRISRP